jgi:hypothetical protein
MTAGLLTLRDWLQAFGVPRVALDSTGVYWKPVYHVLKDAFRRAADQHAGTEARARPTSWAYAQTSIAGLTNSVPLSTVIATGAGRRCGTWLSATATFTPVSDRSATSASDSRV